MHGEGREREARVASGEEINSMKAQRRSNSREKKTESGKISLSICLEQYRNQKESKIATATSRLVLTMKEELQQ